MVCDPHGESHAGLSRKTPRTVRGAVRAGLRSELSSMEEQDTTGREMKGIGPMTTFLPSALRHLARRTN